MSYRIYGKANVSRMHTIEGSKSIHKVGFDPSVPGAGFGTLVVQFTNYKAYSYEAVAYIDVLALLNAKSVGEEFQKRIRSKYQGKLLSLRETEVLHVDVNLPEVPQSVQSKKLKAQLQASVDGVPLLDVPGASKPKKR